MQYWCEVKRKIIINQFVFLMFFTSAEVVMLFCCYFLCYWGYFDVLLFFGVGSASLLKLFCYSTVLLYQWSCIAILLYCHSTIILFCYFAVLLFCCFAIVLLRYSAKIIQLFCCSFFPMELSAACCFVFSAWVVLLFRCSVILVFCLLTVTRFLRVIYQINIIKLLKDNTEVWHMPFVIPYSLS